MIDALNNPGAISAATKTTDVYSANYIDLGSIASVSRFTRHTLPNDYFAVWNPATAMNAADSFIPFIYQADDSAFSTNNEKVFTGPQTALGLAAKAIISHRVPMSFRRYVELGVTPESTGIFTATTINSWFEFGNEGYAP